MLQLAVSGIRFLPSLKWRRALEGIILLLISLMPVLNNWWYILPLLILLFLTNEKELGAVEARELSTRARGLTRETRGLSIRARGLSLSKPGVGLGLFWALIVICAVFSPGFKAGIRSLAQWSVWLSMTWLIYMTFSKEFCKKVLKYFMFTSILWLAVGFMQLVSGLPTPTGWLGAGQSAVINTRIFSVFGNPNIYGLYLLSILVLAVFFIDAGIPLSGSAGVESIRYPRLLKFGTVIVAGLTIAMLYFTYSRGAWLIAGVIALPWALKKTARQPGARFRILLFLSLVLVILFTIPGFNIRVTSLAGLSDSSLQYRLRIWKGVLKAIKDFWVWGIGPGRFQTVYPLYQVGNTASQHAHQLYLQLWLENGIFSLIAFGGLIKNLFGGIHFQSDPYLKPLVTTLIVFLIYGLFETWWMNRFCGGYFWLLAGLLISFKKKEQAVP